MLGLWGTLDERRSATAPCARATTSSPSDALLPAPFDRSAAKEAGVSSGRLRSGDASRPLRGVRTSRAPIDLRERCEAYAVRMREGDCFSRITAALLHGLPVPGRLELAGTLEVADPVAIADHLLNPADGPAGEQALLRPAAARPGRCRTAPLKEALRLARVGSRSPQESRLRVHLVLGGLTEPELNGEVHDPSGRVLGHGDVVRRHQRVIGSTRESSTAPTTSSGPATRGATTSPARPAGRCCAC